MKISVIITTHNRLKYLETAFRSVSEQSLQPIEIIIVDDGSDVHVEEVFKHKAKALTNIPLCFVRIEDLGPSCSRNAGGAIAKGDYLAFLDDDDFWEPEYLKEAQHTFAKSDSDCVVVWSYRRYKDRFVPGKKIPFDFYKQDLFSRNFGIGGSNIVVSRRGFIKINGFDPELLASEDKDFIIRLISGNLKISVLDKPLICHCMDDVSQQLAGTKSTRRFKLSGKRLFLKKHAKQMKASVYFYLLGEVGCVQFVADKSFLKRLTGFFLMLFFRKDLIQSSFEKLFKKGLTRTGSSQEPKKQKFCDEFIWIQFKKFKLLSNYIF